ncbi:MAG: beta-glucosidase [Gemmatimonadaceae bacterium]|nr:beta-glucosidase [Gloeobacterales cyanobacterium ES-bin-141]
MPSLPVLSAEKLNLRTAIGQLIVPRASGFLLNHQRLYPHWELDWASLERAVTEYGIGGVLLYSGSLGDTHLKIEQLAALADIPLLVCADLEAGCGQHIRGATRLPTARAIGETRSRELAYQCGALTAREARAVGFNWVLAPCLDVNTNPDNPVICLRSFGEDPVVVADLGSAFSAGVRSEGVLSTAKHFPGHGDVAVDSHLSLPVVERTRQQLAIEDWLPFERVIAQGVDAVMSAHLLVPELDPDWPATLSRYVLTDVLRGKMNCQGLIVTDALTMGAVSGQPDLGVLALDAGADVLLMPADVGVCLHEIESAVLSGKLNEQRIYTSAQRVLDAKARVCGPRPGLLAVGGPEAEALHADVARTCLQVVRDREGLLPLSPDGSVINILLVDACLASPVQADSPLLRPTSPHRTHWLEAGHEESYVRYLLSQCDRDVVLVHALTPVQAYRGTNALHVAGEMLLTGLCAQARPTVLISYTNPYLARFFPQISTVINAFNDSRPSQDAVFARLHGLRDCTLTV